jgi:hypothetical protein
MKKLFSLLLLITTLTGWSQVNTFNKHLKYPMDMNNDDPQSLIQTGNKGYFICRGSEDTINGLWYYELLRFDRAGNFQWGKRLNRGPGSRFQAISNCVIKTDNEGLLMGTSVYSPSQELQIVLIKTDSFGTVEWSGKYPAEGKSIVKFIKQTSDLGYIVCGFTTNNVNKKSAYIFKIDSSGNFVWGKKYDVPGHSNSEFNCITEIPAQGYVACGSSYYASSSVAGLIVKTDLNGNIVWNKNVYDSPDFLSSVILTGSNTLVYTGGANNGTGKTVFLKTDLAGNFLFQKRLQPNTPFYSGSFITSIAEKSNGDLVFAGYVADPIPSEMLLVTTSDLVVKTCMQYRNTFHPFTMVSSSLVHTSDSGYAYSLMAGTLTGPNGSANYSTIFVKTDSTGNPGCDGNPYSINLQNFTDSISSITTASQSGSMTAFPASFTSFFSADTTFCQNIQDVATEIPKANKAGFKVEQNIPNPFSEESTFSYSNNKRANILFEICDPRGFKVFAATYPSQPEGEHSIHLSFTGLAKGIYFYSFTIDAERIIKKMIIQ